MLFILFGTRGRNKKLDEGEFYCPFEHAKRPYHLKKHPSGLRSTSSLFFQYGNWVNSWNAKPADGLLM